VHQWLSALCACVGVSAALTWHQHHDACVMHLQEGDGGLGPDPVTSPPAKRPAAHMQVSQLPVSVTLVSDLLGCRTGGVVPVPPCASCSRWSPTASNNSCALPCFSQERLKGTPHPRCYQGLLGVLSAFGVSVPLVYPAVRVCMHRHYHASLSADSIKACLLDVHILSTMFTAFGVSCIACACTGTTTPACQQRSVRRCRHHGAATGCRWALLSYVVGLPCWAHVVDCRIHPCLSASDMQTGCCTRAGSSKSERRNWQVWGCFVRRLEASLHCVPSSQAF
jgi:hypothetical protein